MLFGWLLTGLSLAAGVQGRADPGACLKSGDERAINDAFAQGGAGTVVKLCSGSVHRLKDPIHFTAPKQTLTSEGDAGGEDRAMLIVEGADQAVAIFADCKGCDGLTISNLIIDGNRPHLLRVPGGGALIEVGNANGHTVKGCKLYEPRGWSALHVREGDKLDCRKAYIANNIIGPCGEEWDEEYDGLVEKAPTWGNPRADGISLACMDSVVEDNTVFDATDGAIVIFGSRGSQVRRNTIFSRTRVVLGGINLVDYDPWKGDYTGVKVHDNELFALSGFLKVGIVIGPSSWSDDTDTTVHGGTVVDNKFFGERFGYAMVVSSADAFTVLRNAVAEGSEFIGVPGVTCPTAPENAPPTAFLINRGSARGNYQKEFINGEVQHIICINPPPFRDVPYKAWRMRDSPEAIAAREEADAKVSAKLSERLADSLFAYQAEVLGALNSMVSNLTESLEKRGGVPEANPVSGGEDSRVPPAMAARVDALEDGDRELREELSRLTSALTALSGSIHEQADDRRSMLSGVYNALHEQRISGDNGGWGRGEPDARGKSSASQRQRGEGKVVPDDAKSSVLSFGVILALGAVLALALAAVRRWRLLGASNRGLKMQ